MYNVGAQASHIMVYDVDDTVGKCCSEGKSILAAGKKGLQQPREKQPLPSKLDRNLKIQPDGHLSPSSRNQLIATLWRNH